MASQTAYFAPLNVVFLRKYGVFALHTYAPCLTTCCHHARYGCTQILAIFSSFWLFICKYRKYEGFGFFKVKAKRRYCLQLCHAALQSIAGVSKFSFLQQRIGLAILMYQYLKVCVPLPTSCLSPLGNTTVASHPTGISTVADVRLQSMAMRP